ncbi:hypothetical protein DPMN_107862 [Dreissena polymorpha]|uniref:Uncharacterized protein n=1 Tax=Dreissena polymorpha TaxID=45954 RepID=A0A9D4K7J6_DREPO|nr:hypothetical protein DPMN_107862 [Dreissena polymorpha]
MCCYLTATPMPHQRDPRTSLPISKSEGQARTEEMAAMSLHSTEPTTDYDSDSGDEKPDSIQKTQDPKIQ